MLSTRSLCYPHAILAAPLNIASALHSPPNKSGVAVLSRCRRPPIAILPTCSSLVLLILPFSPAHLLTKAASRCYQNTVGSRSLCLLSTSHIVSINHPFLRPTRCTLSTCYQLATAPPQYPINSPWFCWFQHSCFNNKPAFLFLPPSMHYQHAVNVPPRPHHMHSICHGRAINMI